MIPVAEILQAAWEKWNANHPGHGAAIRRLFLGLKPLDLTLTQLPGGGAVFRTGTGLPVDVWQLCTPGNVLVVETEAEHAFLASIGVISKYGWQTENSKVKKGEPNRKV